MIPRRTLMLRIKPLVMVAALACGFANAATLRVANQGDATSMEDRKSVV